MIEATLFVTIYLYWNRLYESTGDLDQAAAAYHQYIVDSEAEGASEFQ